MSADPEPLPVYRFDTRVYAPEERFDRWQHTLGGLCTVSPSERNSVRDCAVEASVWHLGGLIAIDLSVDAQIHARTRQHVRGDQIDHYRLALKTRGRQSVDADGRRVSMEPGSMVLVDQAHPESSFFHGNDGANIVLYIPRDALDEALPRPVDLHGVQPRGGAADILADHLRSLVTHLPSMSAENASAIAQGTVNLVAASIAATADTLEHARPAIESTLLRQVCRYIDFHLEESDLSADKIAAFFKLSRATLYRLFEPYGGVARHIKERRLLRVHAVLSASAQPLQILRVAEDYGFKTVAHLSREFRAQFGYPPSEARQRTHAPALLPSATGLGENAFYAWMRSLRG